MIQVISINDNNPFFSKKDMIKNVKIPFQAIRIKMLNPCMHHITEKLRVITLSFVKISG
jgi:hypothetical protein